MRGTPHIVEVLDSKWDDQNKCWVPCDKFVYMSNNDDEHYNQQFENWGELNEFVAALLAAGETAFGKRL